MATAELAVLLPVLVLVVAAALTAISVLLAQLQCVDAAREAARAAARGEATEEVLSVAVRAGPRGSTVQIDGGGDEVGVTVAVNTRRAGGLLPSFHLTASAVAQREPERSDGS